MMEAVSGSVTAAGIYLKVAAGMDKGSEMGGEREVKRERDGCVMKGEIWLKWGENKALSRRMGKGLRLRGRSRDN